MKKRAGGKAPGKGGAKAPKRQATQAAPPPRKARSRRDVITAAASWGAIAMAIGGVGYWTVGSVSASIGEADLSRIGDGTPSIVQIHDPQCSQCAALQREVRDALEAFDDEALTYLVANITTTEGRALAARHNVGHVTLLLFDGPGRLRSIERGPQSSAALREAFAAHLRASER